MWNIANTLFYICLLLDLSFLFQKEIVNFAAYFFYNGVVQITGTYTLTDHYVADIRVGDKEDTTPQHL